MERMKSIKVIVDPGSTHMGKIEYAKEAIDLAAENKCWAIKFQLFKGEEFTKNGNIELPREWWPKLVEYAKDRIIIFSSVFDFEAIDLLTKYESPYIKIPYSQRKRFRAYYPFMKMEIIISCHPSEVYNYPNCIRLFCIPEYPVLYKIDFNEIFTRYPFNGFSDHTLGFKQTLETIKYGARYIEKHITLNHKNINCPDNNFALRPYELKRMMEVINYAI
jgi:N,N'-diacetyllegionaminate synthase